MEPLDRRDVLASNLLFGTLLLSVAELAGPWLLGWLSPHRDYLPSSWFFSWRAAAAVRLWLALRAGLYAAIRHGYLAAKLLLALGLAVLVVFDTHWQYGVVAGVRVAPFSFYSLLALANLLLMLAALGVAFGPARGARAAG